MKILLKSTAYSFLFLFIATCSFCFFVSLLTFDVTWITETVLTLGFVELFVLSGTILGIGLKIISV